MREFKDLTMNIKCVCGEEFLNDQDLEEHLIATRKEMEKSNDDEELEI